MTDNVNGKQEITEKKEESAQPQEDTGTKGAQSCSDIATEQEQLADSTNVDCGISQAGESGELSEESAQPCSDIATEQEQLANSTNVDCGVSQAGESGEPSEGKANGKCLQKDNLSCTIFWLVGLSLQFILIIVIGLFSNTYSGFSVTVQRICILNESTITLTSVLLFILSIFISILSGYIVYKKDEEKKQKQQDMTDEIKKWIMS